MKLNEKKRVEIIKIKQNFIFSFPYEMEIKENIVITLVIDISQWIKMAILPPSLDIVWLIFVFIFSMNENLCFIKVSVFFAVKLPPYHLNLPTIFTQEIVPTNKKPYKYENSV